ncbi:transcription initiation protein SPT3 homolog [Glandiceps talaboti]
MTKPKAKSKRNEKSKEQSSGSNIPESKTLSSNAVSPASSIQSTSSKPTPAKAWFTTDIQHMMFAMGDCRRPLIESAMLIEDIVHQQVTSLLLKAAEVTGMRAARFISLEDFLFLMRKERDKLKRLLRFISMKDLKSKLNKSTSVDDEDVYAESVTGDIKPMVSKRRKISFEFLNTIDQTGELVALFDEEDQVDDIKQERLERAEKQSRHMDTTTYQEYTECRQINFHKKASKFKDWLDCSHLVDIKPNPLAIEVLCYLAYETVAQVVDLSLLVKRDMEGLISDPFIQATPPSCVSDIGLPSPTTVIKPMPIVQPGSPNHSPPSTPTTPTSSVVSPFLSSSTTNLNASFNSNSSNGSAQQSISSLSSSQQNTTKPKPKKRKKSGATSTLESGSCNAIQPLHIREAIRRYYQCIGPMAAFSKHSTVPFIMRFLSC